MRILFFSFFIFGVIQAQAQQYTGEFNRPFFPKSGQSEFSLMYNYLSIESEDEQSGVPDILLDMMTSKDKNKMVNASLQMRLLF